MTNDQCVGERMKSLAERRDGVMLGVRQKVKNKSRQSWHKTIDDFAHRSPVLVLGFPHGQNLHVTLGRLWKVERKGRGVNKWGTSVQYTAHSCPGDSGGAVIHLALLSDDTHYMVTPPHQGATQTQGVAQSVQRMW